MGGGGVPEPEEVPMGLHGKFAVSSKRSRDFGRYPCGTEGNGGPPMSFGEAPVRSVPGTATTLLPRAGVESQATRPAARTPNPDRKMAVSRSGGPFRVQHNSLQPWQSNPMVAYHWEGKVPAPPSSSLALYGVIAQGFSGVDNQLPNSVVHRSHLHFNTFAPMGHESPPFEHTKRSPLFSI